MMLEAVTLEDVLRLIEKASPHDRKMLEMTFQLRGVRVERYQGQFQRCSEDFMDEIGIGARPMMH